MRKELLPVSGLLIGSMAFTIDPAEIDSLINLGGVVVSANKIHVNRSSVPLSISVIEREETEVSSESVLLPVLPEQAPGPFITGKGVTGFDASEGVTGAASIRGVGQGNRILVLFDGRPQRADVFSHSLLDTYVASGVEKVEATRGPGALLYGSDTIGGVVNIIARQYDQPGRRTQARIIYGSYNIQEYMINDGYDIGDLSSYTLLSHDHTDGHRPDPKLHIIDGFAKLGYKIDDHYKVTGDVGLIKSKDQNPGEVTNPLIGNIMSILRGTTSFALENNYGKTSGALRVLYNWGHHRIDNGYNPDGTPNPHLSYSNDHNAGFLLHQSLCLVKGNSFTIGIDYKSRDGNAWQDSIDGNRNELVNKTVNEVIGYAIMWQNLFDKASLNAGVCYGHNSISGGEWVPQAGSTVRPFEGNVIKVFLSKGFRNPNIREMYMSLPQNPDLKPERVMNYEASIGQTFLDGNSLTKLVAFLIDGQGMIETTRIDGRPKNANTGTFTNKGIEFDSHYQVLKNLSLDVNYSYLHTSRTLLAAPTHKFSAGVIYAPGRFTFDVNAQSIFDLYINTADKVKEDYTVLNAKAVYHSGTRDKGLNLSVKGENLTTTRYSINEGFSMPKAIFMGGIDVTF